METNASSNQSHPHDYWYIEFRSIFQTEMGVYQEIEGGN